MSTYAKDRKRKLDWIRDHGPCADCGSSAGLRAIHKDPQNTQAPRDVTTIFRLGVARREEILADFKVVCYDCWKAIRWPIKRKHGEGVQGIRNCKCEPCMELNRQYSANRRRMAREKKARQAGLSGTLGQEG